MYFLKYFFLYLLLETLLIQENKVKYPNTCNRVFGAFTLFSLPELKSASLIKIYPLSFVVIVIVIVNFLNFHFLPQNHRVNFNLAQRIFGV